jgi:hypothetical protein
MKINPDKILDKWENELISENQKVTMNFLGIEYNYKTTKKEASDLIHAEINKRKNNMKITKVEEKPKEIWSKRK